MKPFKISMLKDEGTELYGQGETLAEAMANLIKAVDEYGDRSDKASMLEASADLLDYRRYIREQHTPRLAP